MGSGYRIQPFLQRRTPRIIRLRGVMNSTMVRSPLFEILLKLLHRLWNVINDALIGSEHWRQTDRVDWNRLVVPEVSRTRAALVSSVLPLGVWGFHKSQGASHEFLLHARTWSLLNFSNLFSYLLQNRKATLFLPTAGIKRRDLVLFALSRH